MIKLGLLFVILLVSISSFKMIQRRLPVQLISPARLSIVVSFALENYPVLTMMNVTDRHPCSPL